MNVDLFSTEEAPNGFQIRIHRLVEDPDFSRIRDKLSNFNFFEVIGVQRREVRHSDFLAFLLNAKGNHGLGDAFLRRFLKRSLKASSDYPGPNDFQVEREDMHVDILLHDDKNRLAVIIENKIDSGEHDDQLERYWNETRSRYPDPDFKLFGIYLTPTGEEPEGSEHYVPFSYSDVAGLIDDILAREKATRAPAVEMALKHYAEMLRRDIVPDSDLRQLCEAVYFKHRDVLDKIFDFKPDLQAVVGDYLKNLIASEPDKFVLTRSDKEHVRFGVKEWDGIETLMLGQDSWERRILWFQFDNQVNALKLRLIIGPGRNSEIGRSLSIRQELLNLALADNEPLRAADRTLNDSWNGIYNRLFLSKSSLERSSTADFEEQVKAEWKQFVEVDFPKILKLTSSIEWHRAAQSGPTAA